MIIHGQPVYEGANDPRMGDLHNNSDPGHFGHIELARPVYHQGFLANVVLKSLRCICFNFSRIVLDIENDFKCQRWFTQHVLWKLIFHRKCSLRKKY